MTSIRSQKLNAASLKFLVKGFLLTKQQEATRQFQLYNQRLMTPVLHFLQSDRLCLKILEWMHVNHPQTKNIPLGLSDEEFGSWPVPQLPTIYFMPSSMQYVDEFLPSIRSTLSDMLTEASPYQFTKADVSSSECDPKVSSPVHLLNKAWSIFAAVPDHYSNWEEQAISTFLANW